MRFSIITPTYKRSEKLIRAVESLQQQTYTDWEMIIVNDSPTDRSYDSFVSSINDSRIHYHTNITNNGINYSKNFALSKISADSRWVIFLDDDTYLAPDTLSLFHSLILSNGDKKWFVTNVAYKNGEPITKFPRSDTPYSYAWSHLILKRCKGVSTQCIETKLITTTKSHFSHTIKNGDDWFFYYQIGLHEKMYYIDHNSTITEKETKLLKKKIRPNFEVVLSLLYEGVAQRIHYHPTFIIYSFLRLFGL
jgi:glycosyltransferase involved in cell wall biosynthesis